ncbi:hypothetical protein ACH5RR_006884 [Cinchona calisaya]|uniref:Uncharacterized protein n=1 Tax=Cinchona calisaya TaxID=153742 RepID=A0ABD3AQ92_9GENT
METLGIYKRRLQRATLKMKEFIRILQNLNRKWFAPQHPNFIRHIIGKKSKCKRKQNSPNILASAIGSRNTTREILCILISFLSHRVDDFLQAPRTFHTKALIIEK